MSDYLFRAESVNDIKERTTAQIAGSFFRSGRKPMVFPTNWCLFILVNQKPTELVVPPPKNIENFKCTRNTTSASADNIVIHNVNEYTSGISSAFEVYPPHRGHKKARLML
jgi:hypothetical protein